MLKLFANMPRFREAHKLIVTSHLNRVELYILWLLMIDHKGHGPKWEAFWMNVHLHAVIVCLYRGTIL